MKLDIRTPARIVGVIFERQTGLTLKRDRWMLVLESGTYRPDGTPTTDTDSRSEFRVPLHDDAEARDFGSRVGEWLR